MRLWLTLLSSVLGTSVDYQTWYSPIVLTGTCDEINSDGHCSTINVWYVYKGRDKLPENVMVPKNVNGFETYVIHALDAQRVSRFGLHQTRILFGTVEKDTLVLNPQVSNVFLKNLERVSNLVRIQESNPEISPEELSTLPDRFDITFDKDAKMFPEKSSDNKVVAKPEPIAPDVAVEPEVTAEPDAVTTPIEILDVSTIAPEPETAEPTEPESVEDSESIESETAEPVPPEAETIEPELIAPTTVQPEMEVTQETTEEPEPTTEGAELIAVTDVPLTTVGTSSDTNEEDDIVEVTTKNYYEESTDAIINQDSHSEIEDQDMNESADSRSSESDSPVDFDDSSSSPDVSSIDEGRSSESESNSEDTEPMYPSGSMSSASSSSGSNGEDTSEVPEAGSDSSPAASSDATSSESNTDDTSEDAGSDSSANASSSSNTSSSTGSNTSSSNNLDSVTPSSDSSDSSSRDSSIESSDESNSIVTPDVVSPDDALDQVDQNDSEDESDGAEEVLSFFPELQNFVTEAPDQSEPKIFEPAVETVKNDDAVPVNEEEPVIYYIDEPVTDEAPVITEKPVTDAEPVTAEAPTFPENDSDEDFDRDDLSDDVETNEDDYVLPTESPEYDMAKVPENSVAGKKTTTEIPKVAETAGNSSPSVQFRTVFNVPTRVSWSDDLMDETSSLYLRTKAAIEDELIQSLKAAGLESVNPEVQGFKKKTKQHNKRHRRGADSAIAIVEFSGSTDNPKNLMTELFEATDAAISHSNMLAGQAIATSAIEWDETGSPDKDEPQCTYGTWDSWTTCDCDVEGAKKYRTLKGFGENCPDKTEEASCTEEDCSQEEDDNTEEPEYMDHSGDADSDDSDDLTRESALLMEEMGTLGGPARREDETIEHSGDMENVDSSDDSDLQEGLFRQTRDRYRKSIEEDLEDLTENELEELYITS